MSEDRLPVILWLDDGSCVLRPSLLGAAILRAEGRVVATTEAPDAAPEERL